MRKTSILSTIAVAILGTTLLAQPLFAQSTVPSTRPIDTSQFQAPTTSTLTDKSVAGPAQSGSSPQTEVKVPDILSGIQSTQGQKTTDTSVPQLVPMPVSLHGNTVRTPQVNDRELRPAGSPASLTTKIASEIPLSNANPQTATAPGSASPLDQGFQSDNGLRSQQTGFAETTAASDQSTPESTMVQPASATLATGESMKKSDPVSAGGNNALHTVGPKLRVLSNGPGEISLNKSARFIIQVENLEGRRAENVIVGINFPMFIEISSSMPSTGSRQMTDGKEESRLIWEIPIVESSTTEKIVIDVIPREPKAFDVDVEWTFKPIRGKATVQVTQAQLQVQMSGPTEVLYGEKALYHVTVSNPGNGTAENVVVMLPEVLGGERASLGDIAPQDQKQFQVELIARAAGPMDLTTTVSADNNISESSTREIVVRRAVLEVKIDGPPMKYAGSMSTYQVTVTNGGDAMAKDVIAAVALPPGVTYESGIDGVETIDGGIRWNVGMLSPGNHRTWQVNCNLAVAGEINIEAATRGAGDLAATDKIVTRVDAVADLVLTVVDPKGPLPTGDQTLYEITIKNRGTRSAKNVDVMMHFSEGIEPIEADGTSSEIAPGQVTFAPLVQIDAGQEVTLKVIAIANKAGSHRFRAQCLCEESDSHEVAEGTTKFFGESRGTSTRNADAIEKPGDFRR